MKEEIIVYSNFIFHVLLSIYCFYKHGRFNISTIISVLYSISALAGLIYYISPVYELGVASSGVITSESALLLWFIDSCCILAFTKFDLSRLTRIDNYNDQIFRKIEIMSIIILSLYLILFFPQDIINYKNADDLGDMRETLYTESIVNYSGLLGFIYYRTRDLFLYEIVLLLGIISIRYLVNRKFDIIDKICILLYVLFKVDIVLGKVSRATMVFSFFEVFLFFVVLYSFLSAKQRTYIIISTSVLLGFAFISFTAISISRFGEVENMAENFDLLRYMGESNINFMSLLYPDLKEPFWGQISFPHFRAILGLDYGGKRIESSIYDLVATNKYHYKNPVYIFYGSAGEFVFNFGHFLGALLALLFYYWMKSMQKKQIQIKAISYLTIIVFASSIMKGVCFWEITGPGNNVFIYLLIIYILLNRYGSSRTINRV